MECVCVHPWPPGLHALNMRLVCCQPVVVQQDRKTCVLPPAHVCMCQAHTKLLRRLIRKYDLTKYVPFSLLGDHQLHVSMPHLLLQPAH